MIKKSQLSFLLIFCCFASNVLAQSFSVASYNIRFDAKGDSGNLWVNRSPVLVNQIRYHDFDIFGTQEGQKHQLDFISQELPQYSRYGKGRDSGGDSGEHSAIYFKKNMFTLLNSGDFWLSETPNVPGKGWDATCCNRICSWVYLEHAKSKKKFYVFNVHFDHQGVVARNESAKLMISKIKEIAGDEPTLLTGDFNGDRSSKWYLALEQSELLTDTYSDVKYPYENNSSFNSFRTPTSKAVIDHIFRTKHFKASKWAILTDSYFGKFPSDHFPVVATVSFR